jgi:hypothetical protein
MRSGRLPRQVENPEGSIERTVVSSMFVVPSSLASKSAAQVRGVSRLLSWQAPELNVKRKAPAREARGPSHYHRQRPAVAGTDQSGRRTP